MTEDVKNMLYSIILTFGVMAVLIAGINAGFKKNDLNKAFQTSVNIITECEELYPEFFDTIGEGDDYYNYLEYKNIFYNEKEIHRGR